MVPSTSQIFQLTSGSECSSGRCLFSDMASPRGLCLPPPLCHDSLAAPPGLHHLTLLAITPLLALSALVPNSPRALLCGSSPSTYFSPTPVGCRGSPSPPRQTTSSDVGSLAGLRYPGDLAGLSEPASSLLREARAPTTTRKGYAYACHRWSGWCLVIQADRINAPVTLVINFLAEFFS